MRHLLHKHVCLYRIDIGLGLVAFTLFYTAAEVYCATP